MNVSDATETYQAMLETRRTHPDNDEVREDVDKARQAMEVAWLNHKMETA